MKILTSCSNKYQIWNPNHLVTIKNTSWYLHISGCQVCQVTCTANICKYQLVFFIVTKWFGFHSWYLFEQSFISWWDILLNFIIVMKEFKPNILAVLYRGTLFNQSGWLFSLISYFICFLEEIIQGKPTWYHFVFNTNLVLIYLTVLTFKVNRCFYHNCYIWCI